MIICKQCGGDVYVQQRNLVNSNSYSFGYDEPYYCWNCKNFKDYKEVTYKK